MGWEKEREGGNKHQIFIIIGVDDHLAVFILSLLPQKIKKNSNYLLSGTLMLIFN